MNKTVVFLVSLALVLVSCNRTEPGAAPVPVSVPVPEPSPDPAPVAKGTEVVEVRPAPVAVAPSLAPPVVVRPEAPAVAQAVVESPPQAPPEALPDPPPVPPEVTPVETVAPIPEAAPPPKPPVPPPAPDLRLEPATAHQGGPVLVRSSSLPTGTLVRYTLDGTDPAGGKPWPAAGLSVVQSGRLRVWAAQPGGEASTAEALLTIGEVWIQPGGTGTGTWSHPLGTLDEGLSKAAALGVRRLRLMPGQWSVKTDLTGPWEFSGGWQAPGERGAPSILAGSKQSGSTQKDPAYTLRVSGAKVSFDGLEIRSPNSSFAAALLVDKDSSVEVSRSRLTGGNGLYGYGLKASSSSVVLTDSVLYGGDGGSSFALSAEKSTVKVVRATFDAGTGNAVSYGLNLTLSKLTLSSSVVWGGTANSSYGIGLYSSEGCLVQGSTILGGKGSSSWALYLSESEPDIVGCLIGSAGKAKSYGIFANYGKSLPRSLRSNAFFGSSSGAFAGADWGAAPQPGEGGAFVANGRAFEGQSGNVRAEPHLGPAPEFRTLGTSPAVLLKGSEPLTGEAAVDRGGKPRGTSPAFGAWATSP